MSLTTPVEVSEKLEPALAELAARGDQDRLPRTNQVGDRGLERTRAGAREDLDLVRGLEDVLEPP
jgi:hypothetical protein